MRITSNKQYLLNQVDKEFSNMDWQLLEESSFQVAPGIIHTQQRFQHNQFLQSIHLLEVDTKHSYIAPVVYSSDGRVERLETVGKMNEQLKNIGIRTVVGVNGDFFNWLGVPSGLQINDGEVITSPPSIKVLMMIRKFGEIELVDNVTMEASVLHRENKMSLDSINRTRNLNHTEHAFLYNWRFGSSTRTPEGGIEVILAVTDDHVYPGEPITGVVEAILETSDNPIERGKMIIAATGKKADWVKKELQIGEELTIEVSYDKGVAEAKYVISGNSTLGTVLLQNGEIADTIVSPSYPYKNDRHPRTMLATKNGKLFIVIVDGRQPGHSNGITLEEGAQYLKSIGMEHAINIDGGGSTTCYLRLAGDEDLTLVNRPSDGFERAVGNGLYFATTAPVSTLHTLVFSKTAPKKILANSTYQFTVKGQDEYQNAVAIEQDELEWNVKGDIGEIDSSGTFVAFSNSAEGEIIARCNNIVQHYRIEVTKTIVSLTMKQTAIVVDPNSERKIEVEAFDKAGEKVWVSPELLDWFVEGEIGDITPSGILKTVPNMKEGKIIAKYGDLESSVIVNVGKPPYIISSFNTLEGMSAYGEKAAPGSVTLTLVPRPEPVRFGTFSGKLTYDFTNITGASKAVIQFVNAAGKKGVEIPGHPRRFGVWVYGDGNHHWLRLGIQDVNGESRSLNFTNPGGLDWKGWKYVYADVAENTAFPITVKYLFITETNDANKNAGALYFNRLRAEYAKTNEDLQGPEYHSLHPEPNSVIDKEVSEISVVIHDADSGVDPSSIKMYVNGNLVNHQYEECSGKVSYQWDGQSQTGKMEVIVEAADMAGNPMVPVAQWFFTQS